MKASEFIGKLKIIVINNVVGKKEKQPVMRTRRNGFLVVQLTTGQMNEGKGDTDLFSEHMRHNLANMHTPVFLHETKNNDW